MCVRRFTLLLLLNGGSRPRFSLCEAQRSCSPCTKSSKARTFSAVACVRSRVCKSVCAQAWLMSLITVDGSSSCGWTRQRQICDYMHTSQLYFVLIISFAKSKDNIEEQMCHFDWFWLVFRWRCAKSGNLCSLWVMKIQIWKVKPSIDFWVTELAEKLEEWLFSYLLCASQHQYKVILVIL